LSAWGPRKLTVTLFFTDWLVVLFLWSVISGGGF
jgi:hypothetical protein